jgi:hypothetical protein
MTIHAKEPHMIVIWLKRTYWIRLFCIVCGVFFFRVTPITEPSLYIARFTHTGMTVMFCVESMFLFLLYRWRPVSIADSIIRIWMLVRWTMLCVTGALTAYSFIFHPVVFFIAALGYGISIKLGHSRLHYSSRDIIDAVGVVLVLVMVSSLYLRAMPEPIESTKNNDTPPKKVINISQERNTTMLKHDQRFSLSFSSYQCFFALCLMQSNHFPHFNE